jgi:hypothetical protein
MKFAKDFIFLPTNIWTKRQSEVGSQKSEDYRFATSDFGLRTPDLPMIT